MKALFLLAVLAFACNTVRAEGTSIAISSDARYYDERVISARIRQECTSLGEQFSESVDKYLTAQDWEVIRESELRSNGLTMELMIVNAVSAGNAWMGHRKSVSVEVKLYEDGALVDSWEGTRDSSGGFGAGFKGSCQVLQRCVNTLGKDVSKWLRRTL